MSITVWTTVVGERDRESLSSKKKIPLTFMHSLANFTMMQRGVKNTKGSEKTGEPQD